MNCVLQLIVINKYIFVEHAYGVGPFGNAAILISILSESRHPDHFKILNFTLKATEYQNYRFMTPVHWTR